MRHTKSLRSKELTSSIALRHSNKRTEILHLSDTLVLQPILSIQMISDTGFRLPSMSLSRTFPAACVFPWRSDEILVERITTSFDKTSASLKRAARDVLAAVVSEDAAQQRQLNHDGRGYLHRQANLRPLRQHSRKWKETGNGLEVDVATCLGIDCRKSDFDQVGVCWG